MGFFQSSDLLGHTGESFTDLLGGFFQTGLGAFQCAFFFAQASNLGFLVDQYVVLGHVRNSRLE